jgi:FkbM family methyltransferase
MTSLNDYVDQVYVLSLPSRSDRRAIFAKQMEEMNTTYVVVDGVVNENRRLACTLGHIKVLEMAIKAGHKKIFICEDDALFRRGLMSDIDGIMNEGDDYDLLFFHSETTLPLDTKGLFTIKSGAPWGTQFYAVNDPKKTYDFLKYNVEILKQEGVDYLYRASNLNVKITVEGYAFQLDDFSDIEKKVVVRFKKKVVYDDFLIDSHNVKKAEKSFWMGHQMLGDVLGFCAAAHLYHIKTGHSVLVWFQPERKAACEFFDGVIWSERTPDMIDCGGNPSLDEWPQMNGVKRFYRFMDPTMTPGKSFDIHFNRPKPRPNGGLIGLITHSNTQGDIDPVVLDQMLKEARQSYPKHRIFLIGNRDNRIVPEGVEDLRQVNGDISWIVDMVSKLDLLITPQSGPCFIAAGWRVPMWVYRSKEAFWDWTLNYDEHKVERWFDRKENAVKEKPFLYINWKSGLGDAILHVSLYYWYAKHTKQKLYFYGNSKLIDQKMREFVDIARIEHQDIDQWIEQIPVTKIRPVDGGPEDFTGWIPVPSDNCVHEHWSSFECSNFISNFIKVMKFGNKDRSADALDFPHDYLGYSCGDSGRNNVIFHLVGHSSGSYSNNYDISKDDIVQLVARFTEQGYNIVFLQPHDEWMKASFPLATFKDHGTDMKALFDEISSARAVFAVDSGIAHVAMCCGTPLYLFKIKKSGGLGFYHGDVVEFITAQTQLDEYYSHKRVIPKLPISKAKAKNIANELVYRENTTDQGVIHSVVIENEYEIQPSDVSGKTVLDIGGNIGAFSAMCASLGAKEVICCEPMLDNLLILAQNVKKYPSIKVITAAIGRSDEYRKSIASLTNVGNNFGGAHVIYERGTISVPVIGLDDILDEVDLLKIDCEGSEFPILYTTKKLSKIKKIVGEFHNFREGDNRYSASMMSGHSISDYTIEGLSTYLRKKGMSVTFRYFADGIGFFKAWW